MTCPTRRCSLRVCVCVCVCVFEVGTGKSPDSTQRVPVLTKPSGADRQGSPRRPIHSALGRGCRLSSLARILILMPNPQSFFFVCPPPDLVAPGRRLPPRSWSSSRSLSRSTPLLSSGSACRGACAGLSSDLPPGAGTQKSGRCCCLAAANFKAFRAALVEC